MKIIIALFVTFLSSNLLMAQTSTAKLNDSLGVYVGKYTFPAGSVTEEIIVVLEDAKLYFNSSIGNVGVDKTENDTFSIPTYNGIASFKRDPNTKKVTGLHIEAMNRILDGIKTEEPPVTPK